MYTKQNINRKIKPFHHCATTVTGYIGGSLLPELGLLPSSISRILALNLLISTFCISMILELSLGSILAIPVRGTCGLELALALCSSKPCLRAIFSTASKSCAVVRLFFNSVLKSLISFRSETFSFKR